MLKIYLKRLKTYRKKLFVIILINTVIGVSEKLLI